jgi:hypothetical protein
MRLHSNINGLTSIAAAKAALAARGLTLASGGALRLIRP